MDAALGWIGELARWLAAWVPRLVHVLATERAVKFVKERTEEIGPGLHLFWPITSEVVVHAVRRQVINLPSQTLLTQDGRVVAASGVIVYSIRDLHCFLVENYDAAASVRDLALAGVRKAITSRTFSKLSDGALAGPDNRMTADCQALLEPLGVAVEYVRLTDFAPVRAFSLLGLPTPAAARQREDGMVDAA